MYNPFITVISWVFYYWCIKAIWGTYKDKKWTHKASIFTGLFFLGWIFASIFVYFLNPNASPDVVGENSVMFSGYFSYVMAQILHLKCLTSSKKKVSAEIKKAKRKLYLSITFPIIVVLLIFGPDVYHAVTCDYPRTVIGNQCCIPNNDFGMPTCQEDAMKMNDQLDYAIENDILTDGSYYSIGDNFKLWIPPGYYLIKESRFGHFDVPIMLLGFDEYGNSLYYQIIHYSDYSWEQDVTSIYYGFQDGLWDASSEIVTSDPSFYDHENNDLQYALFNLSTSNEDSMFFGSVGIVRDVEEVLIVNLVANNYELYDAYYSDFENLVFSIDRYTE